MTKKFKKWLLVALGSTLIASSAFGVVACSKDDDEEETTATEYQLILRYDTQTLSVGESFTLIIDEYNGERDVVWTTDDASVATVVDGVVTGVSVGVTTVTATAGSVSADCMVFVKAVQAEETEKAGINIALTKSALYVGETASVQVKTTGATGCAYTVSDENVATIDNAGNITAKAEGTATVTVTATVNGEKLSKAVSVVVKPDWEVSLDCNSVTLDALASWGETTYENSATITASVLYRGEEQTGEHAVWSMDDTSIATVDGGVITAQKVGETIVHASYEKGGRTYQAQTKVQVNPASIGAISDGVYEMPIEKDYAFSNVQGYDTIPGEMQGVFIEIKGARYQLIAGNASAFSIPSRFSDRNIKIVVATDKAEASFTVGTFIEIANYDDLTALYTSTGGYYKMTADIDMTGQDWSYPEKTIFSGVLNGNGYEIKGLTLTGEHGLFYEVENDITIMNLKLSDVRMTGTATLGSLFATDKDANTNITVENVEVDATLSDTGVCGGLFGRVYGTTTLKNVTVHTYQASHDTTKGGALFGTLTGKLTTESVTVYSALWHTTSKTAPTKPDGTTLIAPAILQSGGKEVRLNFLSESDTYDLKVQGGTATSAYVYYLGSTERVEATVTTSGDELMAMGGKYIEILADKNGAKGYYYIPVDETGYINQGNFYKLPYVSSGNVFLEEDIDFSQVTGWVQVSTPFSGTFDGQNHTISNFTGRMFGEFTAKATAKNFKLVNASTNFAGQGLICDLMRAGSTLENVSIDVKLGYFEKSGAIARYMTDNVNLKNVSVLAFSTMAYNQGFLAGFGTKGASANCNDCLFVVTNENGKLAPCGIRDGSFLNSVDEMGENYTKVLRGEYALYNDPLAFMQSANGGELTETQKAIYDSHFKTVLESKVKAVASVADFKEMLKGEAYYYYLTADIDCTGIDFSTITRDTTKTHQMIIDGNGHKIDNLSTYLFYNFNGTIQNLAFTNIKAGASVCKVAKGGTLVNVFMHGAVAQDADGGLYAQELNAYKGSGDNYLLFDDVMVITTNAPQAGKYQGSIAGYASAGNFVTNENSVFISKFLPVKPRTDKTASGANMYVSSLEGSDEDKKYDGVLKGDYGYYRYASDFEGEYEGELSQMNQTYYDLLKDGLDEEPAPAPGEDQSGDAVIPDRDWA